jgi:tetratricopeptide (TPR) repeat protein
MKTPDPLLNEDYREYVRLLRSLHQLVVEGKEESADAERLYDQMDVPWEKLNRQQQESIGGLIADLNWIRRGPVPSHRSKGVVFGEAFPALVKAKRSRNWHEVLKQIRPLAPFLPPAGLAYIRGRAWSELGDCETALLFFEHAQKNDPNNGKYAYASLECLTRVDAQLAARRAHEVLMDSANHPAAEVIEAASIESDAKNEAPSDFTEVILDNLAETF